MTKKTWNVIIKIQQNLEGERFMERNRILEAAQNNKSRGREYEDREFLKTGAFGSLIALVLCFVLLFVEYFMKGNFNFSVAIMGLSISCFQFLADGIKTKKWYLITLGCVELIADVVMLILFVAWVVL